MEVKRLEGQRYSWPPDAGGEEENVWREQIWVFHMGSGLGSKEPISPFVAADDYDQTREMVSIIRGNGDSRRKMFDASEELPAEYADLKVEILGDRIEGHYNKLCVVARVDDTESMLFHGAAQARLRRF
jgi:hypothetical protein